MPPKMWQAYEKDLFEKISESDSPFLGLYANYFNDLVRENIISVIQHSYDPFRKYIESLIYFPAILSTLLVVQLLEDFGQHGYFEVYPFIEKIFGKELTQSQKQKLWGAFRRACLKLGLSISPRTWGANFMVEEYLRQAGLPLRYVDKFTEKAIRYANQAGVPDIDDPESLKLWQDGLIERLTAPIPIVVRRAIERDDGCYYIQRFIHLFSSPTENIDSLTRLERLMLKTIIEGPQVRSVRRAAIPQIVFRDVEYGVLLPGDKGIDWQITIEGETKAYTSQDDERFIPFEALLPSFVLIRNEADVNWRYTLWEDERNNRLLIFSLPAGKYIKRASLTDKELFLDPGEYLLILRFMTNDEEGLEVFSDEPSLYLKKVYLNPGQNLSLQRGPVELVLKANEIPLLNLLNESFRGIRGNELYPISGLKLETIIPEELIDTGLELLLQLKSQSLGDNIIIPIQQQAGTTFLFNLDEAIAQWKPGVGRLLIELYRKDSKRALARKSVVIWNGLASVRKRILFHCNFMPENLYLDGCENLKVDASRKLITFRDETNRFFKMAFDDNNRRLYFTWAVPGVFLSLLTYTQHGEIERGIRLEETISVNATTRKVLNIFATHPATLQLGEFKSYVDFSRIGSKKIPLAGLIEYFGSSDNTLDFIDEKTAETIPLVKLVSPFEVLTYKTESDFVTKKIHFEVANEMQGIKISTENLMDGSEHYIEFTIDNIGQDLQGELAPGIITKLFIVEKYSCDIYFPDTNWPPGFWLIHFKIKANGRWGTLTNSRNENYADGLLVSPEKNARNLDEVYHAFKSNHSPPEIAEIFCRFHKAILVPYARKSWKNIFWLEKFWRKISYSIKQENCGNDIWCRLLQVSTERHHDVPLEFQIPHYNIGATLPQIYCLDKSCYPSQASGGSSMLGCISFFPNLSDLYQTFSKNQFDVAVLFGFLNVAEVASHQESPQGFNLSAYKEALKQRDIQDRWRLLNDDQWMPGKGDMLGPMHYRYALTRFQETYRNNLSIESDRMGKALFLVRQINSSSITDFYDSSRYVAFETDIDLGLFDYDEQQPEGINDELATERDHQLKIIRFLSLFGQTCRVDARHPGVVESFYSTMKNEYNYSNKELSKTLGYLLSVGEDLFAFYLLLWELVFSADCDQSRRIYVRS